ncbi:DNA polymerase III subunit beta [Micromonospora sp. NPDC000207]|uniref:DNA polymerase III subunit beta n=1 Tax=Micromonospora sp. NPDC000207 TaxID=3154246 RepID=UPI003320B401
MKVRVEKNDLADIAGWVARSIPQRPSVPVLAGVKLTADGTSLTAEGFDYEVSTQADLSAVGGDPGTVLVSGRLLAEITKSLPNKPVDLTTAGTHLELVCGSARFTLPTMPVEDYPSLPVMPTAVGTVDTATFAAAVTQTAVAAGRDDTLPMMTGVRLELSGSSMALLATDRYRLAVRELTWQPAAADHTGQILIPAKTLTEVAKTLAVGVDPITIAIGGETAGEGMVGFEAGGRRMTTRLLDGANYPPVRSLFPDADKVTAHAVLPVAPLMEVVKRVALVAERTTPVLLTFTPGESVLTVEAGGAEEARASESLPIGSYSGGEALTVAYNPAYLLDGLAHLASADARIEFVDAFKPAVISPAGEDGEPTSSYRYLIMPIRVSR